MPATAPAMPGYDSFSDCMHDPFRLRRTSTAGSPDVRPHGIIGIAGVISSNDIAGPAGTRLQR